MSADEPQTADLVNEKPPPPLHAAGWYADPFDSSSKRWWNGQRWNSKTLDTPDEASAISDGSVRQPFGTVLQVESPPRTGGDAFGSATSRSAPEPTRPPAGTYPDPFVSSRKRQWTGEQWVVKESDSRDERSAIFGHTADPPSGPSIPTRPGYYTDPTDSKHRRYWTGSEWGAQEQPPKDYRSRAAPAPAPSAPSHSAPESAESNRRWLFVGLGIAAVLLASVGVASQNQDGASPVPSVAVPQLTSQQRQMQSDWDSSPSDYRREQCRLWLSQTHFDYFVNSFVQTTSEDQRLITWLLDRNC